VRGLRDDLDALLTGWRDPTLEPRQRFSTTHALARRFRDVRRRPRPRAVFQDSTARDRLRFAVCTHDHATQGVPTLVSLTHTF
jgi:hypothetical protein